METLLNLTLLSPSRHYLFKHLSDEKKETITKDKMS